jgi:hypothetical protein
MVELCRQRKTPDSSTRALWKSYQHSHLVASMSNGRREWWIWSCQVCFIFASIFTCRKILWYGASAITSPPKIGVLRILSPLKSNASSGFVPATFGSHGKHYTTKATQYMLIVICWRKLTNYIIYYLKFIRPGVTNNRPTSGIKINII